MGELSDTSLTDRELSKLAGLFPAPDHLLTADYLEIDRVTALNISHNLRGHSHSVTTEYLTRWRNRNQDGLTPVRQLLIELLDRISDERGWFPRAQYDFLTQTETAPVQETHSSLSRSGSRSRSNGSSSRSSGSSSRSSGSSSSRTNQSSNSNTVSSQGPRRNGATVPFGESNYRPPSSNVQIGMEFHSHNMYQGVYHGVPQRVPQPVHVMQYQPIQYPPPIQVGKNQATQDHKLLNRVAGKITDWDEFRTLGLELHCSADDVARLQSENHQSVRTAAYKILSSWYEGTVLPDRAKWTMLKDALVELGKDSSIKDLGIDVLCGQVELGGGGDRPVVPVVASNVANSVPTAGGCAATVTHFAKQNNDALEQTSSRGFTFSSQMSADNQSIIPSTEVQLFDVPEDERQTPVKALGQADAAALKRFKQKLTAAKHMSYPQGIPVSEGTVALVALADSNFLDYGWLHLDSLQKATQATCMSEDNKHKPVVIAVLDTGIYTNHKDLHNIVHEKSWNCVSDRPGVPLAGCSEVDLQMDHFNHGTMVAGLIKRYGPANLRILNYKVLPTHFRVDGDNITDVTRPEGMLEDVVTALNHISTLDGSPLQVDIINMSFGDRRKIDSLGDKLHEMARNKVLIAAAGNDGEQSVNTVQWPAKDDTVISVGACKGTGGLLDLSARGKEIDLLCPGEKILSTAGKMITPDAPEPEGFVTNGTSFSAAFATAVAANVIASINVPHRPAVTSTFFMRHVLSKMSKDYPNFKVDQGYGILKPAEFFENGMVGLHRILNEVHEGK